MKDIKYIIKRILIGTGIAILLMLIKGNFAYDVHALSVNSTGGWGDTNTFTAGTNQTEYSVIHNDTRKYFINSSGYFIFNFAYVYSRTSAVSGQNVDNLSPTVSVINVKGAGGLWFPCYYGSTSNFTEFSGTSQVNGDVYSYSVVCPIRTDDNGIGGMQVGFIGGLPHYQVTYKFGERASFIFDTNSAQVQEQTQELNEVNSNLNELNDSINDDNVNESSSSANSFFNNFDNGDTGNLTDIISLPLDFLSSLNNACSPINLTLPFINTNITIPCISSYLSQFIPSSLLNLIRLVINAIISYRAIASLLNFINGLKDPNNSDLEVMDL